jgi:hypothetical protein
MTRWNFIASRALARVDCGMPIGYLPRPTSSWRIRLGVQDAALSRR